MLGIHWQRGVVHDNPALAPDQKGGKNTSCPDCMTYHGGSILPQTCIVPIYWGTSWATPSFVQDKILGIENWYANYIGSDYETATMSEYCSGTADGSQTCTGGGVQWVETTKNSAQSGVVYHPADDVTDLTTASSGSKTSAILGEVCKVIQAKVSAPNSTFIPTQDDYYPVYVDLPISGGYCAYHSIGSCSYTSGGAAKAVSVQFGFFFNADGNAGCASGDGPFTKPEPYLNGSTLGSAITGHSEGLASLIDSTAHELSETRTDPGSPRAWTDGGGLEIGDKCEFNTGYAGQNLTNGVPVVYFPDGTGWVVQPEWSNKAALANGTNPPTGTQFAQQSLNRKGASSGSYGCVYGTASPSFQ